MAIGDKEICVVCGKTFIKERGRQVACSPECQEAHRKALRRERYRRSRLGLPPAKVVRGRAADYRYGKPESDEKPIEYGKLDRTLAKLKAEGKDYTEEQKRKTIEEFARVKI